MVAITLVQGGAAYRDLLVIDGTANEIDHKTEERTLADSLRMLTLKEGNAARAFLLTGDEKEIAKYESAKLEYERVVDELSPKLNSEESRRLFGQVKRACETYNGFVDREIQLKRESKQSEATEIMRTESIPAFAGFDEAANEFNAYLIKTKQDLDKQQAVDVTEAKVIIIIVCIVGVALGVLVTGMISRSVSGAIARIISMIQELAANNLAVEDLEMRDDEIGRAGLALNEMKNNLRSIIQSIATTADHVASASEEISSSAEQQAQSSAMQKDQTSTVATALQEMNVTVQQVSENSGKASEASHKAADTARHGGVIVEQTLAKMQLIAESVRSTAERVQELGASSDQIGRIVGVINDIADQTNLLALNAAIEAARAGEQGRGFAVVADEVRKLAERTTIATKEIAQMIQTVQQETKLAVSSMHEGTKQVGEGVQTTNQAGEALTEIIQMSEQVGDMIRQIATASTEQSAATEDINHSMEQIANLVRESADGAQQSAKACQDLSAMAFEMQKIVSKFKVAESAVERNERMRSQPGRRAIAAGAGR